jgi:hypothetical protein
MLMPDRDLCADLRNAADPALARYEDPSIVCGATNSQLRLYVAGWMLGSVAQAVALYLGTGLLDATGVLTTESIVSEVLRLL